METNAAYLAIGPVFATPTKPGRPGVTLDYVRWAAANVDRPWFAIGGITLENIDSVSGSRRASHLRGVRNFERPRRRPRLPAIPQTPSLRAFAKIMSLLVVGTTALDSIKTPHAENPRLLGGSASHAAVAASFFTKPHLIGAVGDDFPRKYINLYRKHGLNLDGFQQLSGQTFHWSGEYELNMNNRRTLDTVLGVIEDFSPTLTAAQTRLPYVLLANCVPDLQANVLDQMHRPKFVVADTMDLWLNIARAPLLKLLPRLDCLVLNDSEASQLAEEDNVIAAIPRIHKLGPKYVIVKKGEHGSILSGPQGSLYRPGISA